MSPVNTRPKKILILAYTQKICSDLLGMLCLFQLVFVITKHFRCNVTPRKQGWNCIYKYDVTRIWDSRLNSLMNIFKLSGFAVWKVSWGPRQPGLDTLQSNMAQWSWTHGKSYVYLAQVALQKRIHLLEHRYESIKRSLVNLSWSFVAWFKVQPRKLAK
jgi:hypothetical protein